MPAKKTIQTSIPFIVEPEEPAPREPAPGESEPSLPSGSAAPERVPEPPTAPQPLTVAELTQQIRFVLEGKFRGVLVEGEISSLTRAASGHLYFTLKDTQAQIKGVMFRNAAARLPFRPEQGLEVVVRGSVSVYGPRGEYQLQASAFEPKGVGALQLAFEQLRNRLQHEGLFDDQHKRALPFLPKRIGIVTSQSGAVIHDMWTVLNRRFPGIPVLLYPASVQGERAVPELLAGLRYFAERHQRLGVDLVIIGRGGGSLEDLWAFNNEELARAIFHMPLPIISAVGHETDYTIADFVADLRAPTPSAAMEQAVPRRADLLYTVNELQNQLIRTVERHAERARERVEQLAFRLASPERAIAFYQQRVDDLDEKLEATWSRQQERRQFRVQQADHTLKVLAPQQRLRDLAPSLQQLQERLQRALHQNLMQHKQQLAAHAEALQHLSPLAQVQRGYAMVRKPNRQALRSAQEVTVGERLEIHLPDGTVETQVQAVSLPETPDEA